MGRVFPYIVGGVVGAVLYTAAAYGLMWFGVLLGQPYNERWWASLLYLPVAYLFALLYYFGLLTPLNWLERRLPDGALKRLLFRERGTGR